MDKLVKREIGNRDDVKSETASVCNSYVACHPEPCARQTFHSSNAQCIYLWMIYLKFTVFFKQLVSHEVFHGFSKSLLLISSYSQRFVLTIFYLAAYISKIHWFSVSSVSSDNPTLIPFVCRLTREGPTAVLTLELQWALFQLENRNVSFRLFASTRVPHYNWVKLYNNHALRRCVYLLSSTSKRRLTS